ncbi:MAG: napA [Candidatus Brocadiaceae bacterium]|nr:napA [Candidatus Brocadiaceae bacterium]
MIGRSYKEPAEVVDDEYPFVLNTGRVSCHFNTRTRTGRIPRLNNIEPDNFVEIHPTDATRYGISDGDEVEVTSRRGSVRGAARIRDRVLAGTIFMSPHFGKATLVGSGRLANIVCNPAYDVHSKQPELKYCAVKIAKV